MQIPPNPASTRFNQDVKNYRKEFKANPHAKKEIKKALKQRRPGRYGPPLPPNAPDPTPDSTYEQLESYRDLAFFTDPTPPAPPPNRLGGVLAATAPLPPPAPKPPSIAWPVGGQNPTKIDILPDGTIVHTKANGDEIEEAHDYMHAIFEHILYDTRDKLEAINASLERNAETPTGANSQAYTAAVAAFEAFVADLAPGGSSPYSGAFQFVNIDPVVTNEGFIVSVRVKLRWKNPWHSSSTIRVP